MKKFDLESGLKACVYRGKDSRIMVELEVPSHTVILSYYDELKYLIEEIEQGGIE